MSWHRQITLFIFSVAIFWSLILPKDAKAGTECTSMAFDNSWYSSQVENKLGESVFKPKYAYINIGPNDKTIKMVNKNPPSLVEDFNYTIGFISDGMGGYNTVGDCTMDDRTKRNTPPLTTVQSYIITKTQNIPLKAIPYVLQAFPPSTCGNIYANPQQCPAQNNCGPNKNESCQSMYFYSKDLGIAVYAPPAFPLYSLSGFSLYPPFDFALGTTASQAIAYEDAITSSIAETGKLNVGINHKIQSPPTFPVSMMTPLAANIAPATNCAKLADYNGPKKIIFMRGNGWNSSIRDFLLQVSNIKDSLIQTEPFKSNTSQFSFYVDLQKHDQQSAITSNATIAKAQSSCKGANKADDGFAYIYLYKDAGSGKGSFSYPKTGVAFVEFNDFTSATKGPLSAVRELGHALAGLNNEQVNILPLPPYPIMPETNCGYDPFTAFRISATNHIFGAIDQKPCAYDDYSRPNSVSLMGNSYNYTQPTITANKFDVISCGYLLSAIKGEAVSRNNAENNWPACKLLDTTKDGIPPVVPAPSIVTIDPIPAVPSGNNGDLQESDLYFSSHSTATQGSVVQIIGDKFTTIGNSVTASNVSDESKFFEINNISRHNLLLNDRARLLYFTIPSNILPGEYMVKIGALNSDWSTAKRLDIHGMGPTNLTATLDNGIKLSWADNSSDEAGFTIYRLSGPDNEIQGAIHTIEKMTYDTSIMNPRYLDVEIYIRETGTNKTSFIDHSIEAGIKYTYFVKASYSDDTYSINSNPATITLPKPSAPVLSASATEDSNSILLTWTDNNTSENIEKYEVSVKQNNGDDEGVIGYSTEKIFLAQALAEDLLPNTEYCFTVIAMATFYIHSDDSNTACVRTNKLDQTISLDTQQASSVSGPVSLSFNPDLPNISSVDLAMDDGTVLASDSSAPWNFNFDSGTLGNGSHNVYAIVHTAPSTLGKNGGSFNTTPVAITINNSTSQSDQIASTTPTLSAQSLNRGELILSWTSNTLPPGSKFEIWQAMNSSRLADSNMIDQVSGDIYTYTDTGILPALSPDTPLNYSYRVRAKLPNGTYMPYSNMVGMAITNDLTIKIKATAVRSIVTSDTLVTGTPQTAIPGADPTRGGTSFLSSIINSIRSASINVANRVSSALGLPQIPYATPSPLYSPSPSLSPTFSPISSRSPIPSPTIRFTPTPIPSHTPSPSVTPNRSPSPSPSVTPRPSTTPTPSPSPSRSSSPTPSYSPSPSPTYSYSPSPTYNYSPSPSPTYIQTPTPTPNPTTTPSPSPTISVSPSTTPSPTQTSTPAPTPTPVGQDSTSGNVGTGTPSPSGSPVGIFYETNMTAAISQGIGYFIKLMSGY